MSGNHPSDPLDFLHQPPQPVGASATPLPADLLPQDVADALLRLPGVDGAWIERSADGRRVVVLHVNHAGQDPAWPSVVQGWPVRIQGRAPIDAQGL